MKIKISVAYLISFFALIFVIHELQDWMHVMVGEWICGCWGTKGFDAWTMCDHSEVSGSILAFVWLAGPIVIYTIIWIAWGIMESKRSTATWSVGFSLLFATLPLGHILAAARGASDETFALREIIPHTDAASQRFILFAALLLVLALTVPPLIKAFKMAGGLKERLMVIPVFLLMPVIVDYLVVSLGMNGLLSHDVMQDESLPGTPFLVLIWGFFCLILLLITFRNLFSLFKKSDHHRRKRKNRIPVIETDE
jgi:hypothetical protein